VRGMWYERTNNIPVKIEGSLLGLTREGNDY
jgi:hypothetical protein